MTRGTALIWTSAAIGLAALLALIVVTRDEPRRSSALAAPTSAPPPMPAGEMAAVTVKPPAPHASVAASVVAAEAPVDPIADDSWKLLRPGDPPAPGDPFEDPDAKVQRAKLLSRIGVIRVGILNRDAAVKDEAAVTSILRRAAVEIERLDRDRRDPPHQRFPDYEAVMAKYRAELAQHMTGTAMIGGLGWTLGVKVPGDAGD